MVGFLFEVYFVAAVNNRLFYLALPSTVFISVATAIRESGVSKVFQYFLLNYLDWME